MLKLVAVSFIYTATAVEVLDAASYGKKICRAHIDTYCAAQSKKPGYSCAICAGHYWTDIKPFCNPHGDAGFDINVVCQQKTETRLIRKGTHENDEKSVCVTTLSKFCAKSNGNLPRDHQKCIDCARAHQAEMMQAKCFVNDIYEICHASYSDDKTELAHLKDIENQHPGVSKIACDLMIHDRCRKTEGKNCMACINEHWPEFRPKCLDTSCTSKCEYRKKQGIEVEICESMHSVSARDKKESEDDDDDQSGIQEERVDDSANTIKECRQEITKVCGNIFDFKCKQCAVHQFSRLQSVCYNLDTTVHACHSGDDDDDVAYKKGVTTTNLKKHEDLDEGDDDAAQLERMEKFCKKNVNTVCNIGDISKDQTELVEQLHKCASCMDTKWDEIKQFCSPWWDNDKEKNRGDWDKRNELCAFGVLNKDEDFIKLGKNGQIDVRSQKKHNNKKRTHESSSASAKPATAEQKKTMPKGILLGCDGMITFLCGKPKTGAECMHCVSKHWQETEGGQNLMDSCNMFDDALSICAKSDDEHIHTCIKSLAKHKCLARDTFEGCVDCADSIVARKMRKGKNNKGSCGDKFRRKACEHMFPSGDL